VVPFSINVFMIIMVTLEMAFFESKRREGLSIILVRDRSVAVDENLLRKRVRRYQESQFDMSSGNSCCC